MRPSLLLIKCTCTYQKYFWLLSSIYPTPTYKAKDRFDVLVEFCIRLLRSIIEINEELTIEPIHQLPGISEDKKVTI